MAMTRDSDSKVQRPNVAGAFYPDDPAACAELVDRYLADAPDSAATAKAVIAPHAGYPYSGPVAGSAFRPVQRLRGAVTRAVVIGPSHRVPFRGVAVPSAASFETPLGRLPVDRAAVDRLLRLDGVVELDRAFAGEHALEVELPFLQRALGEVSIVPLVVGEAPTATVARVVDAVWGGDETLIVVSSDLSHFLDYASAQRSDRAAADAIEALDPDALAPQQACGHMPIKGLLAAAGPHGLRARTLDLRSSGDTAGHRDSVVGYGAFLFA
jgi:AmmeMemoRadiSam system protein B